MIGSAGTGKSCILHQFIESKCEYAAKDLSEFCNNIQEGNLQTSSDFIVVLLDFYFISNLFIVCDYSPTGFSFSLDEQTSRVSYEYLF